MTGSDLTRVWARGAAILCIAMAAAPTFGQSEVIPEGSVFQLFTMTRDQGGYRAVIRGTAFFTGADGTALTNSHVVYKVTHEPGRYQLLALVAKEFYSVTIVCASSFSEDPTKKSALARVGRDVAQVRLMPSRFPFTQLGYTAPSGESEVVATARLRALPQFPALAMGDDPTPGEHIRVIGFGDATAFTTRATRWEAAGTVGVLDTASDGTPVFRIQFITRPGPGGSGSPVLDDDNRVVGIYTWSEVSNFAFSAAIGGSAVATPCR